MIRTRTRGRAESQLQKPEERKIDIIYEEPWKG